MFESYLKPPISFPTLTGSIVTFNSQYAGLPLKSHTVEIDSVSGVSAINIFACGANLCDNVTIESGSFNPATGEPIWQNTRVRTADFIPLSSGTYRVSTYNAMEFVVYVYNATDGSYISGESATSWKTNPYSFNVADNRKIKIGIKKPNNDEIVPSEIEGLILCDTATLTAVNITIGQTVNEATYNARTGVMEVTLPSVQTIQLPPCPIDTLEVNNIWADTGDTTIQYPKFG